MATMVSDAAPKKRSSGVMWLILAVCVAPVLFSTLIWWMGWGPQAKLHAGLLLNPVHSLSSCLKSATIPDDVQKHKWGLVVVNPKGAQDARLHLIHQLKLMQGRERERLELYIVSSAADINLHKAKDAPDFHYLRGEWCLSDNTQLDIPVDNRVYLFDPLMNIMLVLDTRKEPKAMHKDLARLLLVSRIG